MALTRSINYAVVDAIQRHASDHSVLKALNILSQARAIQSEGSDDPVLARVAESADDIIVGTVAKMEGHESLMGDKRSFN
ncbi:hypothetical protein CEK25_012835 [Fusarium fujikuroi]|nr:hypothetical protein CEK25_012835 [Fusarium fujikuroi]